MINGILREKEKRIKEAMKIMGLKNIAFYLSWLITYFIIFTLTSILTTFVYTGTIMKNSSWLLVFLWHWEFCMAQMALGFLVTSFFSKAKAGNVFGFVVSFVLGWLEQISAQDGASRTSKIWTSLGPATSVSLGGQHILNFEAAGSGVTGETVGMELLNYKLAFHYIWMLVDFIIFLLLAAYLDQVLPSEFGVRKHPCFCIKRKKKIVRNRVDEEAIIEHKDNSNFEETDPSLKTQDKNNESIIVRNLKKVYPNGKLAVDGVSYNMYQGQIFALLGHNGAGKTSTINMITGLYPATSGTVSVFGMDIHDQLEDIRKVLGVCPQHDVLFDNLTVKEHLELFATFKGMDKNLIAPEIDKMISDLDLEDKRDYLAKNLSGGQKRKLSIGIAFIGGSKFILLDEPSSGMDTSARRRLWDMLKNYKHGKVVLLTTHYMDEADYLGDRIAIMGEGKIQCLGRPLFLKNKFGVGYSLTMVKKDINVPSEPIIDLVKGIIPECNVLSNVSAEVTFQLPLDTTSRFKTLFESLDSKLDELKVSSYGVSVTTLEEVFLNVSKITTPKNQVDKNSEVIQYQKELDDFDLQKERIRRNWELFKTHFTALALKRYHYFRRDKRGLLLELFLPVLMIIIGIALTKTTLIKEPHPVLITNRFFGHVNDVAYNVKYPYNTAVDTNFKDKFDAGDFIMTPKDVSTLAAFDEEIFKERDMDPWRKFSVFVKKLDTSSHSYSYHAFIDSRAQDAPPFAVNKINQAIIRLATNNPVTIKQYISPFANTKGIGTLENTLDSIPISFIFSIGMSFIPASVITFIVKERELNVKHQQIVSGVSLGAYWLSNYFVDIMKYMVPSILSSLVAKAMNAEGLVSGDRYGMVWLLFVFYGFSITSFVYLTSFLFKDYGAAQMATFIGNFAVGFIGALAIFILRVISPSTTGIAKALHWIFRLLPTFSLTYGFLNVSNVEVYARVEEYWVVKSIYDLDIAGADVLYLAVTSVFYFLCVFVVEALRNKKSLVELMNKDVASPEVERDGDVENEANKIARTTPKEYSVYVKEIRKVYHLPDKKHKVAVDKVSFGIVNGECFALLGVNGAGKTTTFKMLTGEILPTKGEIYINGYEVPNQMSEARKYIGYCPQFDALLENLTAKEHLELYAAVKGIPLEKRGLLIEKQLIELNLKQFENIPAGTYSGGNKRKLSVAIAMIGNPPIVFLDEPSNGMDPEARRFMWNVISRISTERKHSLVILTTHSMEEAEALATKIGIQVDGNLKCLGSAQHIKNRYGGGFELEIKLNLPTKDQIRQLIARSGSNPGDFINQKQVMDLIKLAELPETFCSQISEKGSGSAIYKELQEKTKVEIQMVAEWVLIEKSGKHLDDTLKADFNDVNLIEHFQSFYRYRIVSNISIGKIFGSLEEKKEGLNIMQYSVKQSSLEQIFNAFANNAVTLKKNEDSSTKRTQKADS